MSLLRALVVDPDPFSRQLYKTALEPLTTAVSEAEDGADAIGKAICDPPMLVVTETRLARVDGLALCTVLRQDPHTANARIVVVTDAASPSFEVRAVAAGADAVLVKSCDVDQLLTTLRRVCAAPDSPRTKSSGAGPTGVASPRRVMKSHAHERRFTTAPPRVPPAIFCPSCTTSLDYLHSYTGGVSDAHPEQWDYFTCRECGTFRYRHRTRRTTRVTDLDDGSPRKSE